MIRVGLRKLGLGILLFGMAVCCYTASPVKAAESDVQINDTNFPDSAFQTYVRNVCDSNGDGELSQDEIEAVTSINMSKNFSEEKALNLKGIEHFTELQELSCLGNKLTDLDMTGNPKLRILNCDDNELTSLNLVIIRN